MDAGLLLDRITDDEGLVAGLDATEAALLIQSLADRVRALAATATDERLALAAVEALCRKAQQIAALVVTFRDAGRAAAREAGRQHGFDMPTGADSPAMLLRSLLDSYLPRAR